MKTKKRIENASNTKTPPDLMGALSKSQRKAKGKTLTADQIAACFEKEAKRLQGIADILRGKTP